MRKLNFLYICIVLLGLTGCKAAEETNKNENVKESILIWSYYEIQAQKVALDELISGFNLSQDKYIAAWEHIPFSEFSKSLAIGFTSNNQPDLVILDNPDMKSLISQGIFEDITEDITGWADIDSYYSQCMQTVTVDNRIYGLPYCANNLALFYNKDKFAAAGLEPPKNAEEFINAAKLLTTEESYGFAMSAMANEQGSFQLLPWVLEAGKSFPDTIDTYTKDGLTVLSELAALGAIDSSCINYSQQDVARAFVNGDCAMMENGSWILPMVKKSGINYGIVLLPLNGATILGGENLGIVKNGNKDGALAFMEHYNRDDIMIRVSRQSNSMPPKKELTNSKLGADADFSVFVKQMETSVARTSIARWGYLSSLLNEVHHNILVNGSTPEIETERIKQYFVDI